MPWASPKDMKEDVLRDTQERLTAAGATNGTRLVPEGTIFVVVRGMILSHSFPVALAGREMAFNQDMKALRVSSDFLERFVFLWLKTNRSRCLSVVADSSHGTKRLPSEPFFDLRIPAPPLEKQRGVVAQAAVFETADEQLRAHQSTVRALQAAILGSALVPDVAK